MPPILLSQYQTVYEFLNQFFIGLMAIYALYIFNRAGTCIFFQKVFYFFLFFSFSKWLISFGQWNGAIGVDTPEAQEANQKLMFGMLFSLKRFNQRTSPQEDDDGSFHHYTTSQYRLHYYESPTGVKFILLSDPKVESLSDELYKIYNIYVENAVKNPLYDPTSSSVINCSLFVENISNFVTGLRVFSLAK